MSMESVSLIDAVYSARLTMVGLPPLANVQAEQTGVAPSTDPYAAPSSSITTLSGFGQLLSATSRTSEGLQPIGAENINLTSSNDEGVITSNASPEATPGSYTIAVSEMAQSQVLKSAYFTSHDEQVFSAGSFTIAVGSNSPVTVSIGESGGLIGDVGYAWGSLDSMAAVINAAGAGVTASVENDTYGYQLKLTSNATGASNTISLSANDDPFDGGDENLAMLAFAQTQAAKDASFTVSFNGGPASSTQTSPSNQNITSSEGVGFDIVASGTATITVTSAPSFAADTESMVAAATQAIQNYNALIGTAASHTATAGVAATATSLLDEVYSAATATYSGKTLLEGLAITVPGDATGTLTLDSALLETKFAADKSGSAAILSAFVDAIESIANSYLLGEKRAIWENAMIVEEVAMTNNMIDALVDGASGYLAKDIKLYVLQKSLESVGTPTGLPSPSISIFA